MAENTKDAQNLIKEIEAQMEGQTTAVPVESEGEAKTEALETRTSKEAAA